MFKRFTLAAVAAAFAILAVPTASEAGGMKREARAACPVTAMLHRADRAVRTAVVAPRVHVRRERPDWLKAMFTRDRPARAKKRAR